MFRVSQALTSICVIPETTLERLLLVRYFSLRDWGPGWPHNSWWWEWGHAVVVWIPRACSWLPCYAACKGHKSFLNRVWEVISPPWPPTILSHPIYLPKCPHLTSSLEIGLSCQNPHTCEKGFKYFLGNIECSLDCLPLLLSCALRGSLSWAHASCKQIALAAAHLSTLTPSCLTHRVVLMSLYTF